MSFESQAGRTFIALNLFMSAVAKGISPVQLACFDIEKPDMIEHLGKHPLNVEEIIAPQPVMDVIRCKYCGVCAKFCPENALLFNRYVPSVTLIVSRCIACGQCIKGCERKGLKMKQKVAGKILQASLDGHPFIAGQLDESSDFRLPLIKALLHKLKPAAVTICDFGPGNSENLQPALKRMDMAVVIVTPNPDWLSGLEAMMALLSKINIPFGVIINKVTEEMHLVNEISEYCGKLDIILLGMITIATELEADIDFTQPYTSSPHAIEFSGILENITNFAPLRLPTITK